jgi:hypothetical protein
LADDNRVWNIRVEETYASGILGVEVSGAWVFDVEVHGANRSASYTEAESQALGTRITHGGIVFIATRPDRTVMNHVIESEVADAGGVGIGFVALGGAGSRLSVRTSRVEDGAAVGRLDIGILAFAEGHSSQAHLELEGSTVRGRLSKAGRNVVVFAGADASGRARLERCTISQSGQDGVIAIAAAIPAAVEIEIRSSIIEKAAQTNVEGTILNVPAFDVSRADEARVSIEVVDSVVRDAGASEGFEDDQAANVWIGASALIPKHPFPLGAYRLTVRNSTLGGARDWGVGIGSAGSKLGLAPEEAKFDVLLRENNITANGTAEIAISAPNARIDAQRNCWGTPHELADNRIALFDNAQRSQLDASDPVPCRALGPR